MFVSIDHVLAVARAGVCSNQCIWSLRSSTHAEGVRVIIPIINQDFGSEATNWVGNFVDLIRMRRGIQSYEEAKKIDWWTDPECFDSCVTMHVCHRAAVDPPP